MNRVAVLGASGMAGHVIARYLQNQSYDIYSISRSVDNTDKSRALIIEDNFESLKNILIDVKPNCVINCIGVLQRESIERPDKAILLNSFLPQWLSFYYRNSNVKIIHLSTDCVFSGSRGNYIENDTPDGTTVYDRTKALGEINNNKDLTFRMSILGPDIDINGTGLFNWFMKQKGIINGYTNVIWNGITTIELARGIAAAIEQNLTGLYHLTAKDSIDKYSLLKLFKEVFNKNDVEITPLNDVVSNKTLINTRTNFNFNVQSYAEQIAVMKNWIEENSSLYLC